MSDNIIEKCKRINDALNLEHPNFSFEQLCSRDWYAQVLVQLIPSFEQNIKKIMVFRSHAAAIDKMLLLLAEEQFIEKDFLSLKGGCVVEGDLNSVTYMVEMVEALINQAMQEQTDSQVLTECAESVVEVRANHSVQAIQDQFQSSSEEQHQEDKTNQHHLHQQSEQESVQQLKQLNKCNSKQQFSRKHPQPPHQTQTIHKMLSQKVLVTHPSKQYDYRKTNAKLTNAVERSILKTKAKIKQNEKPKQLTQQPSPKVIRKKKEYNMKVQQCNKIKSKIKLEKKKIKDLYSILDYKSAKMKKQRREIKTNIIERIQGEEERYVRTINKLILKLEKEKTIEEHRQFKEEMKIKQKEAKIRIQGLQQKLKNQISLIRENNKQKMNKSKLLCAGQIQIVRHIQKELKRDYQKQKNRLLTACIKKKNRVDQDIAQLSAKIINVYKKY